MPAFLSVELGTRESVDLVKMDEWLVKGRRPMRIELPCAVGALVAAVRRHWTTCRCFCREATALPTGAAAVRIVDEGVLEE